MKLDSRRYYDTTQIVALFHLFLLRVPLGSIEMVTKKIKKVSSTLEKEPDLLIKNASDYYTIIELKSSVSDIGQNIQRNLENFVEYDSDFSKDGQTIAVKFLCFLCHEDDAKKIYEVYEEMIKKGEIKIPSRKVTFLTWKEGEDTGGVPSLYIKFYKGETNGNQLLEHIKSEGLKNTIVNITLYLNQKRFYFLNSNPPYAYICFRVREHIVQQLLSVVKVTPIRTALLKLPKSEDFAKDFILKYGNDYCKPKISWIDFALKLFEELGWLIIKNDCIEVNVEKFTSNWNFEDGLKYFAKKLCRKLAKPPRRGRLPRGRISKKPAAVPKGQRQRQLKEF